jgi:hypothetical protein
MAMCSNIKIGFKRDKCNDMEWIHALYSTDYLWTLLKTIMKFWGTYVDFLD